MKKLRDISSWLILGMVLLLLLLLNIFCQDNWLNSDMAAEMIFSRLLSEEHHLFASPNWYYSTEFRVLYTQLCMVPLFSLFKSWHVIRCITNLIFYALLLFSYFYFMRANLLRAVSHDLRTPLTGIIGNSQAYLDNRELLTEDEKIDIITNIYEDSSWLVNMVENLLTITRIHSSLSIKTSEEPLEEVVGEALIRMQKQYPNCVIHAKIPEDFILLPMDAVLIEQVIINLLENALKHSGSDSPIDFIVENDSRNVTFIVRDYGNGISKAALSRLFSGTPISSPEADGQKGAGIGLVICKTIIDAHHGTILGRNHENGAEFLFTLPKKKEEHPCPKK